MFDAVKASVPMKISESAMERIVSLIDEAHGPRDRLRVVEVLAWWAAEHPSEWHRILDAVREHEADAARRSRRGARGGDLQADPPEASTRPRPMESRRAS